MDDKLKELRLITKTGNMYYKESFPNLRETCKFIKEIELLKTNDFSENIIEFDNLKHAVDIFASLYKEPIINEIKSKIKVMALDLNIDINNRLILKIVMS